jgi:hypothetical protein
MRAHLFCLYRMNGFDDGAELFDIDWARWTVISKDYPLATASGSLPVWSSEVVPYFERIAVV